MEILGTFVRLVLKIVLIRGKEVLASHQRHFRLIMHIHTPVGMQEIVVMGYPDATIMHETVAP